MATEQPKQPRKKRPNGTGTETVIHRTVRGKTYVYHRVSGYVTLGNDNVRVVAEGATPAEARERLTVKQLEARVNYGELDPGVLDVFRVPKKNTLEDLIRRWLEHMENDPNVSRNTWKAYEAKARNYLIPYLGSTPVRQLTEKQLSEFFSLTVPSLRNPDGSQRLKETAQWGLYNLLDRILRFAVDGDELDKNPLRRVHHKSKARATPLEVERIRQAAQWAPQAIAAKVQGRDDELRWLLALYGLRQSEVLGLTDDSLRMKRGKPVSLRIRQQLDRITARHGCGAYDHVTRKWRCGKQAEECPKVIGETKVFIREETKTDAGTRELPLDSVLQPVMVKHLERLKKLRAGAGFQPLPGEKMDSLIFVKSNGHPLRHQEDNVAWRNLMKEVSPTGKLNFLRLHDARHLAVTVAIEQGISREKLAMIFGWSPRHVDEMVAVYGAPSANKMIGEEMETLGRALAARRTPTKG